MIHVHKLMMKTSWKGGDGKVGRTVGSGQSAPLQSVVRQWRVAIVRGGAPREAGVRAVATLLAWRGPHGAPARRRDPPGRVQSVGVDPEWLSSEDSPARLHRGGGHAQRQEFRVEQVVAREVRQLDHDCRGRDAREVRVVERR